MLISTSKKKKRKKKAQAGNEWSNILPKSSSTRNEPPPLSKWNLTSSKYNHHANNHETVTTLAKGQHWNLILTTNPGIARQV